MFPDNRRFYGNYVFNNEYMTLCFKDFNFEPVEADGFRELVGEEVGFVEPAELGSVPGEPHWHGDVGVAAQAE